MAISPKITFPTQSPGYSTNLVYQTISGTADPSSVQILVNGSSLNVDYASGSTNWSFTTMLSDGTNQFNIAARDSAGTISIPATTITVTLTTEENLNLVVKPPTGIFLERSKDSVTVSIIENEEPQVVGYNFYGSEDVGGGSQGFVLLNRTLVKDISFYEEDKVTLSEQVTTEGNIRSTMITEEVVRKNYFSYVHNRVNQPLGNKPITEPNHYVVTAVAFDPILQQQVESPFSPELGTSPILLDTSVRDLQVRNTSDIQQSYIDQILTTDSSIDVKPGTVTRDIHINPPSDEFERLYIIQDFMHRSQSFLTLLAIDDEDEDGISDPVLESNYKLRLKEALLISDENADQVQTLIDDAFTKLAGNVNVRRKEAQQAIGQVTFFTRRTPTKNSTINSGAIVQTISDDTTPTIQFRVLTDFTLNLNDLDNFFNPVTQRYEVTLDVQAIEAGLDGNVDAAKIQVIVSGIDSVFGIINNNPTEFGQDLEPNALLAQRALLAFVSVDVGTEGGYLATTLGTPNVSRAKIISADEDLMMRDIDPLRLVHTYGKVDIYIQGNINKTISETFGFSYATVRSEQALIQSADLYYFRVQNPSVNIDNPIYDVIEIKNLSKGASYDTTGFRIINDGQVVDIDQNLPANISIGLNPSDVIAMSYRFRSSSPYTFSQQPVESIVSVTGELSGPLTSANYILEKLEDPLTEGNSTISKDRMQIRFANGLPTGGVITVTDESILLLAENESELERFGIDPDSIIVTDNTGTVTYLRDFDYVITAGSINTKTFIRRIPDGSISSGQTVLVDYSAGENMTVQYNVNTLLSNVQNRIDKMRHLTADVIVKNSIRIPIDFDINVVLEAGSDQTSIDRRIRTAVARVLTEKQIGESVYQSDIVNVIEDIPGVSHVIIPFTKMVKSNNSYVMREVYSGGWQEFQTLNVTAYKSVGKLSWETLENGGPTNLFRGVFENDIELLLVARSSLVAEGPGRAYIDSEGYLYVSTKLGPIATASITTTYIVVNARGARDINFSDIEYGSIGTMNLTFDFVRKFRGF
jgi:hypothetical protein